MPAAGALQVGAVADDDRGQDQHGDARRDQAVRLLARALPLVENPAPHRAEDDDARHVQRPRGEAELAHLRLAHRVEEELEVPRRARQRGEKVVSEHGDLQVGRRGRAAPAVLAAPLFVPPWCACSRGRGRRDIGRPSGS